MTRAELLPQELVARRIAFHEFEIAAARIAFYAPR
jgi:hypothetical protein